MPTHDAIAATQMSAFIAYCARETGLSFANADAFHAFSVEQLRTFWSLFLAWSALPTGGHAAPVCVGEEIETAVFFPDLHVNYTQCLLRALPAASDDAVAITACNERGDRAEVTRAELRRRVLAAASGLRALGISPGDRVVAIASNTVETIVACLAAVALGATWSSIAPDVGAPAVLARFAPLEPKALFFHGAYLEGGERRDVTERIARVAEGLPSLAHAVALRDDPRPRFHGPTPLAVSSLAALGSAPSDAPLTLADLPLFPWNHPLFILFSSGTTGRPKCLVHGAGGTLLEHHKEHRLHSDLSPKDKLYFHTTCSWMMWNWLVSAIAVGSEIVLYEGSITHPEPDALFRLIARERVTVFGTSPAFLQYSRDAGIVPRERYDLEALRAIQSTGSVLRDALFEWVASDVKALPVQSISGGTDILGCFLLGNPNLPVYAGEIQSKSLGLDVRALAADHGGAMGECTLGELVCANPFPSRPIGIYGDASGDRFHATYFAQNPGYWTHGDLLEATPRGTFRIHGRTDGVLNVRGVRIGPAEIYGALEAIDAIAECMAVEQRAPLEPGGSRLVLLVVLRKGVSLDKGLILRIRRELSERCSPAHVPAVVAQVAELPVTHNGKRAERAARDALNGEIVANLDSLKNPNCLDALRTDLSLRAPTTSAAPDAPPSTIAVWDDAMTEAEAREKLLPLWQDALGANVGVDDDFHELGGHSLIGISLLVRVEASFGRRLPMGTFLAAGATVGGMARELSKEPDAADSSTLVVLQPRGERLPIYWLPGGGGVSTMAFREVSLLLGQDQPVFGFESPLVVSENARDLREAARLYVEELRATRPGPYALLGFSYGSFMAFEVGCQLRAAGERVALLAVFDTPAPRPLTRLERATVLAERGLYHVKRTFNAPDTQLGLVRRAFTHRLNELRERRSSAPPAPTPPADPGRTLFDEVNRRNLDAIQAYAKGPLPTYPGRITVILARETSYSGVSPDLDARLAWQHYATDGIDVRRVSGTHLSMLTKPDAYDLAETLRACLDEVQEERAPRSRR